MSQETIYSPARVALLMHYRHSPERYEREEQMMMDIREFVAQGILMRSEEETRFKLTDAGQKWVDMILDTPRPIPAWVDPRSWKSDAR